MKMVFGTFLVVATFAAATACKQSSNKAATEQAPSTNAEVAITALTAADSAELTQFVRTVYKWLETKSKPSDFEPKADQKDSAYIGIDWTIQNKREKELAATGYFSKPFLDNYNSIAKNIDAKLKNGTYSWLVGELPDFGGDSNYWCDCQDYPDNYWNIITISQLHTTNKETTFNWSFGPGHLYKAVAVKTAGHWQIQYLQGFDYKAFDK